MSNPVSFQPGTPEFNEGLAALPADATVQYSTVQYSTDTLSAGYTIDEWVDAIDNNALKGIDIDDFDYDFSAALRARDFILRYASEDSTNIDPLILTLPGSFDPSVNRNDENKADFIRGVTTNAVTRAELLASIPARGSVSELFGDEEDPDRMAKLALIKWVNRPVTEHDWLTNQKTVGLKVALIDGSHRGIEFVDGDISVATGTAAPGQDLESKLEAFYKLAAQSQAFGDTEAKAIYNKAHQEIATAKKKLHNSAIPVVLWSACAGLYTWGTLEKSLLPETPILDAIKKDVLGQGYRTVSRVAVKDGQIFASGAKGYFMNTKVETMTYNRKGDAALLEKELLAEEAFAKRSFIKRFGLPALASLVSGIFLTSLFSPRGDEDISEDLNYFNRFENADAFAAAVAANPEMKAKFRESFWRETHMD